MSASLLLLLLAVILSVMSAATNTVAVVTATAIKEEKKDKYFIPKVFNSQLSSLNAEDVKVFYDELKEHGIIALRVPSLNGAEFASVRRNAFSTIAKCVKVNDKGYHTSSFNDGTQRKSFAGYVASEKRRQLIEVDKDICEDVLDVSNDVESLRLMVDKASQSFASMLDASFTDTATVPMFDSKDGERKYETFTDIVNKGDHLDHLHVYEKHTNLEMTKTINFHTDQGLFVAIVPALEVEFVDGKPFAQDENEIGTFEILLDDESKKIVKLPQEDKDDVIIFMIGEGSSFINEEKEVDLRAVPHALTMLTSNNKSRVWFGRMFFPPQDALLGVDNESTFVSAKKHAMMQYKDKENYKATGMGCSSSQSYHGNDRVLADATNGQSCAADEIYCWMTCKKTSTSGCPPAYAKCVDFSTGKLWDGTTHCDTCGVQCNACSAAVCKKLNSPTKCKTYSACCAWYKKKCILKK